MPPPPADAASEPARDDTGLAAALAAIGDRWTPLVVAALLDGPRRFGDLQQAVAGIAPNVLTDRLRRLEREQLAIAEPYSQRPPRYVYELTPAGHDLADALRALGAWGARHRQGGAGAVVHEACGTPLELRWWCPTCQRAAEPHDEDDVAFA